MCGRYELLDGQRVFIRFRVTNTSTLPPRLLDNLDVRPTQQVPVLTTDRVLSLMTWGITPAWSTKPLINARAEGIESKPSFRKLLPAQRCLIPASAFFEWKSSPEGQEEQGAETVGERAGQAEAFDGRAGRGGRGVRGAKVKYRIARRDGDMFAFAGLYQVTPTPSGGELHTCTIITTTPNALMAPIHSRMPVMLLPDDEERWLDPDLTEPEEVVRFLVPYPTELLEAI